MDSGNEGNYITPQLVNKLQLLWKDKKFFYELTQAEKKTFKYNNK